MADFHDAEKLVAEWFRKQGCEVTEVKENNHYYDLILSWGKDQYIVQVKDHAKRLPKKEVITLDAFLNSKEGKKFKGGLLINTDKGGFVKTAQAAVLKLDSPEKIVLGVFSRETGEVKSITKPVAIENFKQVHIAVCTCKGGVGKTTVAAHLAGALTMLGYSTALVDVDPQQNLLKLLDPEREGVKVTTNNGEEIINCFSWDEFKNSKVKEKDAQFIIYDCSPSTNSNPKEIFKNSDYCLIPINLCPLGIGKNSRVLQETFNYVRETNPEIISLTLVNNEVKPESKQNSITRDLRENLKNSIRGWKIHLLRHAIRHSDLLYYWGDQPGKLAFSEKAGRCHPREDFVDLANDFVLFSEKLLSERNIQKRLKQAASKVSSTSKSTVKDLATMLS